VVGIEDTDEGNMFFKDWTWERAEAKWGLAGVSRGAGWAGVGRLPCVALSLATKFFCLLCVFKNAHDKYFFKTLCLIHKNYQTKFKIFRELIQIRLSCLLLIETSFEVKTQFEFGVACESNHIFRNSMELHERCFNFKSSYVKKCSKLNQSFPITFTYDIMRYEEIS
jgi:hypothetical protein